jgi:hypothetical protein
MPILMVALVALGVFLVIGGLLFTASLLEHKPPDKKPAKS